MFLVSDWKVCIDIHSAAKYGGAYIDAELLSFASMRRWYTLMPYYDLVNIDWSPENFSLSITAIGPWRANNSLALAWQRAQKEVLDSKIEQFRKGDAYPMKWAEMCAFPLQVTLKTKMKRIFFSG